MSENITNGEDDSQKTPQTPDIDELQALIKQKMAEDEESSQDYFDDFESAENFADGNYSDYGVAVDESLYDIQPKEKKYVVAISPDNVPFFEDLEPQKRAELVNTLVSKYIEQQKHTPEQIRTREFIRHAFVVLITVAVGFPLIFYLTNISIEATVNSYREIQSNFEKLYQQKGGIKRKDLTKIQNLQY